MAKRSSFVDYLVETLEPLGPVSARAMFGGYGLSLEGRSIGLVDEDTLYLKVDEETRALFEAEGSEPFRYGAKGEEREMRGYYAVPPSALDNAEALCSWGRLAVEAAMRAPRPRPRKKKQMPARRDSKP